MLPGRLNWNVPTILDSCCLALPQQYLINASSWKRSQSGIVLYTWNIQAPLGSCPWNLNFFVKRLYEYDICEPDGAFNGIDSHGNVKCKPKENYKEEPLKYSADGTFNSNILSHFTNTKRMY